MPIFVDAESVAEQTVTTIESGLRAVNVETFDGRAEMRSFYHDMPVWLLVEQTDAPVERVFQLSAVRLHGPVVAELSFRRQGVTAEDGLVVPVTVPTRSIPLDDLSVEWIIDSARDVAKEGQRRLPSDGGGGDDYVSTPLSPTLVVKGDPRP